MKDIHCRRDVITWLQWCGH